MVRPVSKEERQARLVGRALGITFRQYERWGNWPIKAYGSDIPADDAPDFQDWPQALEWVKGLNK